MNDNSVDINADNDNIDQPYPTWNDYTVLIWPWNQYTYNIQKDNNQINIL